MVNLTEETSSENDEEPEEVTEGETVSTEEVTDKEAVPTEAERKCLVISDKLKPWVECCQEFEAGNINEETFTAQSLVHASKFMKSVKEKKSPEETE